VLVLAVVGVLVAAPVTATPQPADTTLRLPGTTLRFGTSEEAAAARGFTAAAPARRSGICRFFGMESNAWLTFEDDGLVEARFTVDPASPGQISYVRDQLRRMGYDRRCELISPRATVCDWYQRTHIHLEVRGSGLEATISPPESSQEEAEAVLATAAEDTVPVMPETLAVHLPSRPSDRAEARVLSESAPVYPEAAREAGIQGRVWVLALVDTSGSVLEASIERGISELDEAALECVRQWRFEPRTWQEAPCRYWVATPVAFTLH
jgi:TonB family protein